MTKNSENTAHSLYARGTCIVLLLALLAVLPACYTILKHPTVIQEDYTRAETQRCNDCHLEDDVWGFHHPRRAYYPNYGYRNPWAYYYDVPWWYDSYWFYDDTQDPETTPLHQRSLRPGGDKDPTSGAAGGNIGPPAEIKTGTSTIKTKVKTKDDSQDDTGKTTTDQKRTVRPSKKKKKDN